MFHCAVMNLLVVLYWMLDVNVVQQIVVFKQYYDHGRYQKRFELNLVSFFSSSFQCKENIIKGEQQVEYEQLEVKLNVLIQGWKPSQGCNYSTSCGAVRFSD